MIMSSDFEQSSELETEGGDSSISSGILSSGQGESNAVLAVPTLPSNANHLLLVALLEYVCSLHVANRRKREKLFKVLCNQLAQMNIMSPLVAVDELSTVRSQYRQSFSKLLHHSVTKLKMDWCPALPGPGMDPRHIYENRIPRFQQPSLDVTQMMGFHTSRYRDEFEELEPLGRGAYGSVFKVRHRLDSKLYAVKKVAFQDASPDLWYKTLREVKHLADLNHSSVIRYYTAWLEYQLPIVNIHERMRRRTQDDFDLPALTYYHDNDESESDSSSCSPCVEMSDPSFDNSIIFQDASSPQRRRYHRTNSWELSGPDGTRSDWFKQHLGDKDTNDSISTGQGDNDIIGHSYVALYIQMELCCQTLKDWLQERNNKLCSSKEVYSFVEEEENLYILREVLHGVHYMHGQNLIHRDLKPGNIFLNKRSDRAMEVKIGDFGLVRQTLATSDGDPSEPNSEPMTPAPGLYKDYMTDVNSMFLTSGVGTTIYASPEQLAGVAYGPKSDMYSVGLINLEMFQPFCTGMERSKTLVDLRKGNLSDEFAARWPIMSEVIQQLIDIDPDKRPSAEELLSGRLFHTEEQMITALKRMLAEKERECQRKDQELREKDKTIESMQGFLAQKDLELEKLRSLLNPICETSS